MEATDKTKPLGAKAYGSIAHLSSSRIGPGDHFLHAGQERILTEKTRDRHDRIIIQEKLDGSCVSVARVNGELIPLGRAGYRAQTSRYVQHQIFFEWVYQNIKRFEFIREGERVCGEWIAQAHGTRYRLANDAQPFVMFDLFRDGRRITVEELYPLAESNGLHTPRLVSDCSPIPPIVAYGRLVETWSTNKLHEALDPLEGIVYRCERKGTVDFLGKWVRADKADGCYLPDISGRDAIWNWWPSWRPRAAMCA